MPGLVPGIHVLCAAWQGVDGRDEPGHDAGETVGGSRLGSYTIRRYQIVPDGQSFRARTSLACRSNFTETSGAQPSTES
ncbi:hypothetical protein ACVWW6_003478 [Bradyrhizobium sp. USDA 3311]